MKAERYTKELLVCLAITYSTFVRQVNALVDLTVTNANRQDIKSTQQTVIEAIPLKKVWDANPHQKVREANPHPKVREANLHEKVKSSKSTENRKANKYTANIQGQNRDGLVATARLLSTGSSLQVRIKICLINHK